MSFRNNKRLYFILLLACFTGYIWLYFSINKSTVDDASFEVCIIKRITDMPCFSCGTTRSVISLTQGDFIGALRWNPIGYLIVIIMVIAPIWVLADVVLKRSTFLNFYQKIESYLKKPKYTIPLILLVIINWIWNIIKGI